MSHQNQRSDRWVFGTMLVAGLIALIASFVLTIEKFHLLANPEAVLSCSFNIALNCSTVMQQWQSSVFGFPNMIIGLMAYSVIVTVAVIGLTGVKFTKPFLMTANVGYLLGTIFSYWLFFQSVYAIQVLCPWCLVVTFTTTLLLATMTHYNLKANVFGFKKALNSRVQKFIASDFDKLAVACWIVLMIVLVFLKFGEALFA